MSLGLTVVVAAVASLAGCSAPAPPASQAPDYSKTPVLFVHGSGLNYKTWDLMIEFLVSEGYPREYLHAIDLVPNNGSNVRAAEQFIAPGVERLISAALSARRKSGLPIGSEKVDIVAHSMGAFSSRWYVAKVAPRSVRTWIALAGSNHGTNALRGLAGRGNEEMVPAFSESPDRSNVQVLLNGSKNKPLDETPYGLGVDRRDSVRIAADSTRSILYISVFIDPDRWIKPASSALLDGAGGVELDLPPDVPVKRVSDGNFFLEIHSGHDNLPEHRKVIVLLAGFLAVRDR